MAFALLCTISCTPVSDTLGENLIPGGQDMNSGIDSSFRVETSLFKIDSIGASNNQPTTVSVGSYVDPLVGMTSSQAFSEFSTISFGVGKTLNKDYFGKKPVCDSIVLYLDIVGAKGDTIRDRQYEIYRVNHRFYNNMVYYSNFVMPSSYLGAEPLARFSARRDEIIRIPLPVEFANELMETTEDPNQSPYFNDSLFHQKFNGFYFRSSFTASATDVGNMVNISMYNTKFRLYYRNENHPGKDTSYYAIYTFQLNKGNASFEMVQHDYSLSDVAAGGIDPALIGRPDIQTQYCYAQGMAGVGTMVKMPQAQIQGLKERILSRWPGFSNIAINRAVLRCNLVTPDVVNYNKSYTRLGLYYDLTTNDFIPDYNAIGEEDTQNPVRNLFGGYLNRSLGYYEMDITSYFQALVRGVLSEKEHSLQMLPYYSGNLLIQRSQMYGSASPAHLAPQMIITYTVLR